MNDLPRLSDTQVLQLTSKLLEDLMYQIPATNRTTLKNYHLGRDIFYWVGYLSTSLRYMAERG